MGIVDGCPRCFKERQHFLAKIEPRIRNHKTRWPFVFLGVRLVQSVGLLTRILLYSNWQPPPLPYMLHHYSTAALNSYFPNIGPIFLFDRTPDTDAIFLAKLLPFDFNIVLFIGEYSPFIWRCIDDRCRFYYALQILW